MVVQRLCDSVSDPIAQINRIFRTTHAVIEPLRQVRLVDVGPKARFDPALFTSGPRPQVLIGVMPGHELRDKIGDSLCQRCRQHCVGPIVMLLSMDNFMRKDRCQTLVQR